MIDEAEVVTRLRAAHDAAPVVAAELAPVLAAARSRRLRQVAGRAAVGGVVACGLVLAGLTVGPWAPERPGPVAESPAPVPDVVGSDPAGLVGLWRVSDAVGAEPGTVLSIGNGLDLLEPCGWSNGAWAAGRTVFLGTIHGKSEGCAHPGREDGLWAPPWLERAVSFAPLEQGWELRDAAGERLATLTADVSPTVLDDAPDGPDGVPVLTEELLAGLAEPAPLPPGFVPASAEALQGRWVPAEGTYETDPNVVFRPGWWDGSDGCNLTQGRWALEPQGRFLGTTGGSTDVGCDGVGVPSWVAGAARMGFAGDVLVLFDAAGAEVGRLVRD